MLTRIIHGEHCNKQLNFDHLFWLASSSLKWEQKTAENCERSQLKLKIVRRTIFCNFRNWLSKNRQSCDFLRFFANTQKIAIVQLRANLDITGPSYTFGPKCQKYRWATRGKGALKITLRSARQDILFSLYFSS